MTAHAAAMQEQAMLDTAAATWATRRRNGLGAPDEAALQTWLSADPRHPAALAEMEQTVGRVRQLPADAVKALRAGLPQHQRPAQPARRGPRRLLPDLSHLWPRASMAALATVAVLGVWMAWGHWQQQPTFTQVYATTKGQHLDVSLPDATPRGSTLQLDTSTRVEARLFRHQREVHLQDGQALFAVKADASRPFHVLAGPLRITVVGTRFAVRHTASGLEAGRTVVSVEEGRVRVARADAPAGAPAIELGAGQKVTADASGHLGRVDTIARTDVAAWREGRISFDQAPLADVVAEFERYGDTGLVIHDPAVARMPVGGSHDLRHFQHFIDTLPQVLPVQLVRQGHETEVRAK